MKFRLLSAAMLDSVFPHAAAVPGGAAEEEEGRAGGLVQGNLLHSIYSLELTMQGLSCCFLMYHSIVLC